MTAILYGECVSARDTATVRIWALANEGCDLEIDTPTGMFDSDVALWIGAVGPFAATITQTPIEPSARRVAVRFKEPLDGRILQHFNA
ncbi:hypothetical protein [Novosphingobium sp. AP12]|uniref:hypothetical protein n=1 Tax=Novosphingobium sp. AP12 TaxID=1144305 RepID=UPI0002720AD7|nr:hypothetical protein [Novosphingobium sp. AP12]EJL28300.1 hypothetical protein PMI02_02600 [Novosphingobium sp. AP12]